MPAGSAFRFAPFRLDPRSQRLLRDDVAVSLEPRAFKILLTLVQRAGELVPKEELLKVGWDGRLVSDHSLTKVVSQLRNILDKDDASRYIETAARVGYRFIAIVTRVEAVAPVTKVTRSSDDELEEMLAPHRSFYNGRAWLESLNRTGIVRATSAFTEGLAKNSEDARCHIGLANARVMQFESTRAAIAPDVDALRDALIHAKEGARLAPHNGEAWSTLGYVLVRTGARTDGLAAHGRAVSLDPGNWRHHFRLAECSWGNERLCAARTALALMPELPMARFLTASVYVGRGAPVEAERELAPAIATATSTEDEIDLEARFPLFAVFWLKGMLCRARGADDEAMEYWGRELALESIGHLYSREIAANTWYAIGVLHADHGNAPAALKAFGETIARVPLHPLAHAAMAIASGREFAPPAMEHESMELTFARAAVLAARGDHAAATEIVSKALAAAPPGNAGWLLPIEPLISVRRAPTVWAPVLAKLRARAV